MGNDANLVNSVRRYPICRMHTHFIIKGYFFLMFQEPLPDRLVQKHAGNLTVSVRNRDYFMVGECVRFLFTSFEESKTNE